MTVVSLSYNHYVLGATDAEKLQYPSKGWRNGDIVLLVSLGWGFWLWVLNEIFDGEAGLIHSEFLRATKILALFPFTGFFTLAYIGSSYGSEEDVALGTDWAMTTAEDPSWKRYIWSLFFLNSGFFYMSWKLRDNLQDEFDDAVYL